MNDLIDQYMIALFNGLDGKLVDKFDTFRLTAQYLAGSFALITLSFRAYRMFLGGEKVEFTPILRPFFIGVLIMLWADIYPIVTEPIKWVNDAAMLQFKDEVNSVEQLSKQRYIVLDSVQVVMNEKAEQAITDKMKVEGEDYDIGLFDFTPVVAEIKLGYLYAQARLRHLIFVIFEHIALTIWQAVIFLILFLSVTFKSILIILGPFVLAFSILEPFRTAWISWLSRLISVGIYPTIAYIILVVNMATLKYGLEQEIDRLRDAVTDNTAFVMTMVMDSGGVNNFAVTLICGTLAMLSVPVVSTWIINTSGAGAAIGSMVSGAFVSTKAVGGKGK